jgi:uncharacterized protein (TIGR03083 family)
MDITEHLAALRREGELLAATAASVPLDTPVPVCPGWSVRDLVRHIGGVHRWAAHIVATASPTDVGEAEERALSDTWGADDELIDWYRAGHAALLDTLATAPADLSCFTFLPDATGSRDFWARRQAHETTIHRVDAASAAGATIDVDPALAADGIDELLHGFFARRPSRRLRSPVPVTLRAVAPGRDWLVRIGADGATVVEEDGAADCTVTASAPDLYLLLWNRRIADGLDIQGDPDVLALWRERATVR